MGMKVNGSTGLTFPDSTTMSTGSQAVRAWVNFNGTGTVAIRASYNVTSITDNGTGSYTVNFTTAMPDANYTPSITTQWGSAGNNTVMGNIANVTGAVATTSLQVLVQATQQTSTFLDADVVAVAIFR